VSATQLIWRLAGHPSPAAASSASHLTAHPARCSACGHQDDVTATADKFLGPNFADRGLLRFPSSRVCRACAWCLSGRPPSTLRLWTVIASSERRYPSHPKAWLQVPGLTLTNRANPGPVATLLADPPSGEWVCAVSISGQRHIVPFAPVNHGPGKWVVMLEQAPIAADPQTWRYVHSHVLALRRLGIPADAISSREPRFIRTTESLAQWRDHDAALNGWHSSPLVQLALWTITKETMNADA